MMQASELADWVGNIASRAPVTSQEALDAWNSGIPAEAVEMAADATLAGVGFSRALGVCAAVVEGRRQS